jgi:hypothetical protein
MIIDINGSGAPGEQGSPNAPVSEEDLRKLVDEISETGVVDEAVKAFEKAWGGKVEIKAVEAPSWARHNLDLLKVVLSQLEGLTECDAPEVVSRTEIVARAYLDAIEPGSLAASAAEACDNVDGADSILKFGACAACAAVKGEALEKAEVDVGELVALFHYVSFMKVALEGVPVLSSTAEWMAGSASRIVRVLGLMEHNETTRIAPVFVMSVLAEAALVLVCTFPSEDIRAMIDGFGEDKPLVIKMVENVKNAKENENENKNNDESE